MCASLASSPNRACASVGAGTQRALEIGIDNKTSCHQGAAGSEAKRPRVMASLSSRFFSAAETGLEDMAARGVYLIGSSDLPALNQSVCDDDATCECQLRAEVKRSVPDRARKEAGGLQDRIVHQPQPSQGLNRLVIS